jgi:hypothetical protein
MKSKKPILLTDIPKKEPYHAPAGYFEHLPDQILARATQNQSSAKRKLIPYFLAVAAGVALLMVLLPGVTPPSESSFKLDVSTTEAMDYLQWHYTEEELVELIQPQDSSWDEILSSDFHWHEEWLLEDWLLSPSTLEEI